MTDRRTDVCDCRVAFATENFLKGVGVPIYFKNLDNFQLNIWRKKFEVSQLLGGGSGPKLWNFTIFFFSNEYFPKKIDIYQQ